MDFSKLSQADRVNLIAGLVVAITAIISIANEWGYVMAVSLVAGLGVAYVVLQPQIAPAMKLPASKALSILALGVVALVADALAALTWFSWILKNIADFDTIQFTIGVIAAAIIAWQGWRAYAVERGTSQPAPGA